MSYTNTGLKESAVVGASVDKLHLYNNVTTTDFNASLGPYERNMQRRAKHAQKYFNYSQDGGNGVITASLNNDPEYGVESMRIADVVPELSHLG